MSFKKIGEFISSQLRILKAYSENVTCELCSSRDLTRFESFRIDPLDLQTQPIRYIFPGMLFKYDILGRLFFFTNDERWHCHRCGNNFQIQRTKVCDPELP